MIYNESVTSRFVLWQTLEPETELLLNSYGSLVNANIYFDNRLRAYSWKNAPDEDKKASLAEATELINRLNYKGDKTNINQIHEFPRDGNTYVPKNIEKACYEIALKLLDGYEVDFEIDNLANESQGYSSVRSTYNRTYVLDHIRAGIPSFKAWQYLKPYLADINGLKISRVN